MIVTARLQAQPPSETPWHSPMKDDAGNPAKNDLLHKLSRSFLAVKRKFMEYQKHSKKRVVEKWSGIPTKMQKKQLKNQIKMGLKREFQPQSVY